MNNEFIFFLESFLGNVSYNMCDIMFEGLNIVSDDKPFDLNIFTSLKSFNARRAYVKSKLKQLGVGSSRATYDIGDGTVLKMAINKKGIAQNDAENDGYFQNTDSVAKIHNSDKDGMWLVSDKVDNVNPSEFQRIVGFPFSVFCAGLANRATDLFGKKVVYPFNEHVTEDVMKKLEENELFSDLIDFIGSADLQIGDLFRIGSYGKHNGKIVLRDSGYTGIVDSDFYHRSMNESTEFTNKIVGGKGDNLTIFDLAKQHGVSEKQIKDQLNMGIKVEHEHTTDKDKATEIAMDHLSEIPDYYTRLKKMEQRAGVIEENGFNPQYNKHKFDNTHMTYKEQLILAILRMYNAMNEKDKQWFIKHYTYTTKHELDKNNTENDIIYMKNDVRRVRDAEKDADLLNPGSRVLNDAYKSNEKEEQKWKEQYMRDQEEYEQYKESHPDEFYTG